MKTLGVFESGMKALRNSRIVELVNIPNLTEMALQFAFANVKELKMENASMFERNEELLEWKKKTEDSMRVEVERKEKEEEERKNRIEKGHVVTVEEFEDLHDGVASMIIEGCKDYSREVLDFSRFTELEELKIEKGCFDYPSKVKIESLRNLKRVEIASGCFLCTNADSELVIEDCPALTEVVIGDDSFPSFKALKMDSLPALQKVQIGKNCFKEVNLEVKKMESLESLQFNENSFEKSLHAVIEGDKSKDELYIDCPKLKTVKLQNGALRGVKSDQCDMILKGHEEMPVSSLDLPLLETMECGKGSLEQRKLTIESSFF